VSTQILDDDLLAGLSAALGQSLTRDRTGQCVLLFEGDVEVVLAATEGGITVRSALLALTPGSAAMALEMNYGQLPPRLWVALDRRSGLLVLFTLVETGQLTADTLVSLVAETVGLVPQLRAHFAGNEAAPVRAPMPAGIRG
jgi:hypothetical protein